MTHFIGSVVLLAFTLAIPPWLVVGEDALIPPGGAVDEGLALQLFFNRTAGLYFDPSNTCADRRVSCDNDYRVTWLNTTGENLRGSIPNGSIANLTRLRLLDLSNNSIAGLVPDLSHLSNLSVVRLDENLFTSFPNSFPSGLAVLDLTSNNLSGPIPPALFNLRNLISVKLANNRLSGNINFAANAAALETLDLSNNSLSGNIMDLALKSAGSVTTLDLSSNKFSSFPSDFTPFVNLTTLNLADNKFLRNLIPALPTKLVRLNLSRNNLVGSIPTEMKALAQVDRLDLSTNNLTGKIPDSLKELTLLGTFNVSTNNLSGPIPRGQQFDTFDNTSFLGNPGLCGFPLSRQCTPMLPPPSPPWFESMDNSKGRSFLDYVSIPAIGIGFVLGYVLVWLIVILSDQARLVLFRGITLPERHGRYNRSYGLFRERNLS